jgi:hypothetical protein
MTTTSRPTTARKRTARTETKRADALEQGLRLTLDGESYEIRLGDVTSTVTRELRRTTGMSFNELMRLTTTDPDTDVIAAFVWLARHINGEKVDIDDVVVAYSQLLDDGFDVEVPGKRTEDDGPEA